MKRPPWKDKDFRSVDPWLHYIDEELVAVRWRCEACSTEFAPPWTKKTFPRGPVRSKNGGWLAPSKFSVPCPRCKAPVWYDIPVSEFKAQYRLCGDEAYRDIGEYLLINYSLVGCNVAFVSEFESLIRDLKSKYSPDRSPDSWSLHMKELWASAARARHAVFSQWSDVRRHDLVQELFQFVESNRPKLYVANMSACFRKAGNRRQVATTKNYVQRLAFAQFITSVVADHTAFGVQPNFVFDTEKYDGLSKEFVQQWARESFFGSQVCIYYPF